MIIIDRFVEIWLPVYINGEKTQYMVSDSGKIKNAKGKIRKTSINSNGYEQVHLRHNGKDYTCRVHRLVSEAFIKNPENKPTVNHIKPGYKNRTYNDVDNLEWATISEQVQDTIKKGTHFSAKGEDNPSAKFTNDQIHTVCKLLEENKLPIERICELTGVSDYVIYKILSKANWTFISDSYNIDNYTMIRRKHPESLKHDILTLINKGYSFDEICNELNLPKINKYRCLVRNIKTTHKTESSTTIENEEDMYTIHINL